jgi:hypothetical protein
MASAVRALLWLGSSHGQCAELEVRYLLEQLWPVLLEHCYG